MKALYIFLFLISGFTSLTAFSQNTYMVSGTVKDNKGNALAHVTISLLKAKDSTLVKSEISNNAGKFEMQIPAQQTYLLLYTMVGYQNKYSNIFSLNKNYNVVTTLQASSKKLEDVSVTARRPLIEIKADKTVFNVEGSINAQGSNALELLQKSPGMRVDNNDNISMKGKTGVKIYIDGKMTQLDTKSLAAYLKSINSNDMKPSK